ncbi:MAG TPA: DUF805 domain-containing protein [Sphingomicrobium sp.]|nr:DUF805 domain-containing protein [Sphingomicrobium sp.]
MDNLSPIAWALRPLKRYAEFSGRSSRAEFWWFFLFMMILYAVMYFFFIGSLMSAAMTQADTEAPSVGVLGAVGIFGIFMILVWLALLVPSIAVGVRRLHDTNRSGWWLGGYFLLYAVYLAMLFGSIGSMMTSAAAGTGDPSQAAGGMFGLTMVLGLLMFVYAITLIVFYCLPGTTGPNRYGDDPYGTKDLDQVFG